MNILLIADDTKQHYCWIKDICKLLSLQTSKHGHVRHVCFRWLNTFNSEKSLASHHEYCKSYEAIKNELPERYRKYLLKITIGQCESYLLYMLILNPSHHTINMPTKPWEELETHPQRILLPHKVFWRYTLFSTTSYVCKTI